MHIQFPAILKYVLFITELFIFNFILYLILFSHQQFKSSVQPDLLHVLSISSFSWLFTTFFLQNYFSIKTRIFLVDIYQHIVVLWVTFLLILFYFIYFWKAANFYSIAASLFFFGLFQGIHRLTIAGSMRYLHKTYQKRILCITQEDHIQISTQPIFGLEEAPDIFAVIKTHFPVNDSDNYGYQIENDFERVSPINIQDNNNLQTGSGIYYPSTMKNSKKKSYITYDKILDYALKNQIEEFYFIGFSSFSGSILDLAYQAEKHCIRSKFLPNIQQQNLHIIQPEHPCIQPVFTLRSLPLDNLWNRLSKRIFDISFSFLVNLFILSWVIPIIAILIKLDSNGPVFFVQLRSGRNNRPFWCYKFRTLRHEKHNEAKQVIRNDHRVTRIGAFLRKTNLDELPQFLNVLSGDMTVVGPRPHMLKHTDLFSGITDHYMVRHFVKPGVTGLAQVNGFRGEIRNTELLHKRVQYDIKYLENWSMLSDLQIILKTIIVSIRGDANAY